jgi:hypothetical protein
MDEKDFFYNPWINLGLGILGGNTGDSRSDAFANAMRGGQGALKSVQEDRMLRRKQKEEEELNKLKKDEYERLKRANEMMRSHAGIMAGRGGSEADFWKAVEQDPKLATDVYDTLLKGRYYEGVLSNYGRGGSGGGSGSNLAKLGYGKFTGPQMDQLKAEAASKLGEDWGKLSPEEQTSIAMELGQRAVQGAAIGAPYENVRDAYFNELAQGRAMKGPEPLFRTRFGDVPNPFASETPTYRKALTPGGPAGPVENIVIDKQGVRWRYNGSGDVKDKANYTRVK